MQPTSSGNFFVVSLISMFRYLASWPANFSDKILHLSTLASLAVSGRYFLVNTVSFRQTISRCRAAIFIICSIDLIATCVILFEYCLLFDKYYYVIMTLCIFPGAILINPVYGMAVTALRPNANYIRIHVNWTKLSYMSVLVASYIYGMKYNQVDDYIYVSVIYLVLSKLSQRYFSDVLLSASMYKASISNKT
jgi:hypothetical protein